MVQIGGSIQQMDFVHRCDGRGNPVNHFGAAGFGKIGDTFD
jgi:hypothetical protein